MPTKTASRKRPNPIRRRLSCPECGFIFEREGGDGEIRDRYVIRKDIKEPNTFSLKLRHVAVSVKCPRCEVVTPWAEFWAKNYGKWGLLEGAETDVED